MAYQVTGNTVITDLNTGVFANVNILSSGSLIVTSNNNLTYLQGNVGYAVYPSPASPNAIQRMPFASESVSSDIGALTLVNDFNAGQGSNGSTGPTHGYVSGTLYNGPVWPTLTYSRVERFPFSSPTAGSGSIGNLVNKTHSHGTSQSATHGYVHGGAADPVYSFPQIQKFPFSASITSTVTGSVTSSYKGTAGAGGCSSSSHGYIMSGWNGNSVPFRPTAILKYAYATDSNATNVGSLISEATGMQTNLQSETHGYCSGGGSIMIQKFPFSYDAPTVIVGRMINPGRNLGGGMSGKVNGYKFGGYNDVSYPINNYLDRFSFVTDEPSTSLGQFGNATYGGHGFQTA